MYSIGEFSKLCGLTVKTLRFYHEQEVLVPARVDRDTGYRYYDHRQIDAARVIKYLRGLELSLDDIKELLKDDEADDLLDVLQRQRAALKKRITGLQKAVISLDRFISEERQA